MKISTRDLGLARPGVKPLRFADLVLSSGDSLLLLGPSGSGKTTLLSLLAGLLPASEGAVYWDDVNLQDMTASRRDKARGRHFGFVFQTLHLLPSLSIGDNIRLAATIPGADIPPERLDGLLEQLGLRDKAAAFPSALSQGEQQRAAIARAVYHRPSVIFADEPTSALDDRNAALTIDLLIGQARENKAALVVATHDTRIRSRFTRTLTLNSERDMA